MGDAKQLSKEELRKLLETPLDPDLDYFDATASLEAMANHIRDLHKLINFLFSSMATQGNSILDIRDKMIGHKEAIENIADAVFGPEDDGKPKLIGFDPPPIIRPN